MWAHSFRKAAEINTFQYFLQDKSIRVNENSVVTQAMQDFTTAFHLTTKMTRGPQQGTEFCSSQPFSSEWELPSTQIIDGDIEDIIYNNNTLFLLNTQTFSVEIRSVSLGHSAQKTSKLGLINSEVINEVSDPNVFFLVHERSSTFFIATKDFLLHYKWDKYDDAHASKNPEKEYPSITEANKASGYTQVKELAYAYIYDDYLVVSAAGKGLFIYDLSGIIGSKQSNASLELLTHYDAKALDLPADTSIYIIDTAYDAQYQLLYVLDKINGIFVFDYSALDNFTLLQKNDLAGGVNIELRRGIVCVLIEEGRNRYLKEYFREYHNGKVKDHYLNRRLVLEPGGGELWSDENYAYLMIGGFSYMYRIGVPDIESQNIDDYFNTFISIPFESMETVRYNHQSWVITVGNGLLNAYRTTNYPAQLVCNSSGILPGVWVYEIKAYQTDCAAVRDNEKSLTRPNSSYCIFNQNYAVSISEYSAFDEKKLGMVFGLGIGLFVAVLLFVVMCHLIRTFRSQANMLQDKVSKFTQLAETEESKSDVNVKQGGPSENRIDRFRLDKTDPGSVENRNIEPKGKPAEVELAEKKEAVNFGPEIPDVDEIYNTDDGNP